MEEKVVILSDIRSVHNVGSIFRTADGAGVQKIYLCGLTPTPLDRWGRPRKDFAKVSLGAEKNIPWEHHTSTSQLITKLKEDGYTIIALEQDRESIPYDSSVKKGKCWALVVGSEVEGLSASILKKADTIIEIPMRGKKESLNASIAFGIAIYALTQ